MLMSKNYSLTHFLFKYNVYFKRMWSIQIFPWGVKWEVGQLRGELSGTYVNSGGGGGWSFF